MKKTILYLLFAFISINVIGQKSVSFLQVPDSTTAFLIPVLPVGSLIEDAGSFKMWQLTAIAYDTTTLATATKTLLNADGSSIYTADDTVGAGRIATLTDNLTFTGGQVNVKGAGATSSTKSVSVSNSSAVEKFFVRDDGAVSSTDGYSVNGVKYFHNNGVVNNVFAGSLCGENVTGVDNVGLGRAALWVHTTGTKNIAIGGSSLPKTTTNSSNVAIGALSMLNLAAGANHNNVGIGVNSLQTHASGSYNTSIGTSSGSGSVGGTGNTYIGAVSGSDGLASYSNSIALGREAEITGSNQLVIGATASGAYINNMYVGRGIYTNPVSLASFTMNATGVEPVTYTDGSAALSVFNIAGGRGTGTGAAGAVVIQTAPVGTTGSTQNALVDALKVDASKVAGETRFLIYDVDNGTLERVTVGAADSGGSGYKVLRIAN